MTDISKILCVFDEERPDSPALGRSAWFAAACGAKLGLLAVHYSDYLLGHPLYDQSRLVASQKRAVENVQRKLERVAAKLAGKYGIEVTATAIWDHPEHEGVVRHLLESGADIVFRDAHLHSALRVAILSNEDWQLIRSCPVPLWIVKRETIPDKPAFVAAVDPLHKHDKPAELDESILRAGEQIAGQVGGELHAFHSFDPRIAASAAEHNVYIPVSLPLSEIEMEMRDRHARRFREVVEPHDIPADRVHLLTGLPDEELPRLAAKLDATAVVMGAIGRNAMKQLFIGSTAERTLNRLPCDLIAIKPNWFETPVLARSAKRKVTAALT